MVRAADPRQVVGGQMSPEAVALAGQGRQMAENRLVAAMRESGATERGKTQAAAQVQTAQTGAETSRALEAMRMQQADKRAAEQIANEAADREFMAGQTRLNHYLLSQREEAARLSEDMQRTEDRELWKELYTEHEENETARQMIEHYGQESTKRAGLRLALSKTRNLKEAQGLYQVELASVKRSREQAKIRENIENEVEEDIVAGFYPDVESEEKDTTKTFLERDFRRSEINNPGVLAKLLDNGDTTEIARRIARKEITRDDVEKMYVILKTRKRWLVEQVGELKDIPEKEKKKLGFWDTRSPKWTMLSAAYRAKYPLPKKPTERERLLRDRQEKYSRVTYAIDSLEALQNVGSSGEITMDDKSEKVLDFMSKVLGSVNSPVLTMDYEEIMSKFTGNLDATIKELEDALEGNSSDFEALIDTARSQGASPGVINRLKKAAAIRKAGGAPLDETNEPSEADELSQLGNY